MPNKLSRSIATFQVWHDSTNKDCYDASSDCQKPPEGFKRRKCPIKVQDNEASRPYNDLIGHKHLPSLNHVGRVEEGIHRNDHRTHYLNTADQSENPGKEVPPSCKPATESSIWSCCDGSPVIDYSYVSCEQMYRKICE
jgi:hypothetical protein